jgi:hypothetical protein
LPERSAASEFAWQITEVFDETFNLPRYVHDHRELDGIMVPTCRRVFPLGPDNKKLPEPVLITIDITEVRFA